MRSVLSVIPCPTTLITVSRVVSRPSFPHTESLRSIEATVLISCHLNFHHAGSSTLTPYGELPYTPGMQSPDLYDRTATATPNDEKEFKAAKDSAGAIGSAVVPSEKKPARADQPAKTAANGYLDYADGLRGIAMISYSTAISSTNFVATHPGTIQNGTPSASTQSIGLVLFYMLSGRLNATSLFQEQGARPADHLVRRSRGDDPASAAIADRGGVWLVIQKVECGTHAFDQTVIAKVGCRVETRLSVVVQRKLR